MQDSARGSYLETEVLTAPPQKLQLMLIEAAMRSVLRACGHLEAGESEKATEGIIHAQQVVSEVLGGLNREANPELAGSISSVYLFLFRNLTAAGFDHDKAKLDEVLNVLEIERETWQQVCRRLEEQSPSQSAREQAATLSISEPPAGRPSPHVPNLPPADPPLSGFWLDA